MASVHGGGDGIRVWRVALWLSLLTAACGAGGDAGSAEQGGAPAAPLPSTSAGTGGGADSLGGAGAGTSGASGQPGAGGAGASAASAGASAASGSGGASSTDTAGAGGASDAGASGGAGTGGASSGPTLPSITDPGAAGPFDFDRVDTVGGLSTHTLFVPRATNTEGKHPAVVWTCGNGGTVSFYASFLEHLASHGFLVLADKASSSDRLAEVDSQRAAIAWLIEQHASASSDFSGKIDTDAIAVMGHSLGSLASFATAAESPEIATSVHFSGGLTGNPVGFDEKWLAQMTKPAAFLCGGADGTAGPSCALDFEQAPPALPVFYGVLAGASHIGPFAGTPRGGEYGRAAVAWLRWRLARDPAFESFFVGGSCTLCSSPWTAQQRNLP